MMEFWVLRKAVDANLKKCSYCWFEIMVADNTNTDDYCGKCKNRFYCRRGLKYLR